MVPVLFTFYTGCAKFKIKNNSGAKRLMLVYSNQGTQDNISRSVL